VRSIFLNVVLFLACGVFVVAQNPNSRSSGAQNSESSNTKSVQTVRGCLSKTGNTYVILGGTPMRQYRIIGGDIAAFQGKQNKIVEVTGLIGQKESGAATNGQYGPGSTTGVDYDTIIAKSVKVVVDNCGL
jgi:hypothetical protein